MNQKLTQPTRRASEGRVRSTSPFGLAPFDDVGRMLGRLFADFPARTAPMFTWASELANDTFQPRIELIETESGLRLNAELPGLRNEDLELRVEDGQLVLFGEKKTEQRTEKEGVVHTERSFGSFRRSLTLPFEVDMERAQAHFENGLLTVELPRAASSEPQRKIEIRSK